MKQLVTVVWSRSIRPTGGLVWQQPAENRITGAVVLTRIALCYGLDVPLVFAPVVPLSANVWCIRGEYELGIMLTIIGIRACNPELKHLL